MTTETTDPLNVRPQRNVMFGLTHDMAGKTVMRVPRSTKIGIGLPGGKDVELYIDYDGQWVANTPGLRRDGKEFPSVRCPDRATMQSKWSTILKYAATRKYPKKLDYFTFTRPGSLEFDPDWDMIEAHGPRPTSIGIMFTDNEPYSGGYQWWASTELKCYGDGINAMRVISLAEGDERELAARAAENLQEYFPVIEGCASCGCPYLDNPCKPVTALRFQLVASPRLGSSAYFHSTSKVTAQNVVSFLSALGEQTGGNLAGIPFQMVLRSHKVTVQTDKGKRPSTAWNVGLEFRADQAVEMRQKLLAAAASWQQVSAINVPPAPAALEPPTEADDIEAQADVVELPAAAITQEFYPHQPDPKTTQEFCPQPAQPPDNTPDNREDTDSTSDEDKAVLALWNSLKDPVTGKSAPKRMLSAFKEWERKFYEQGGTHGHFLGILESHDIPELTPKALEKAGFDKTCFALRDLFLLAERWRIRGTPPADAFDIHMAEAAAETDLTDGRNDV